MKQRTFYREISYIVALLTMSLGASLMEHADFGLSMVIAPAYLLHRAVEPMLGWFSFGVAEIVFQAMLLSLLCLILRRFRFPFLFSFVTSVIYGFCLDNLMLLVDALPSTIIARLLMYVIGMFSTAAGVAFFCRTYLAPEVYELFVSQLSLRYNRPFHKIKTGYDCASCLVSVGMAFTLFGFGEFVGIGWGTVLCALVNGTIIGWFERLYDRLFVFKDAFPKLRRIMP